MQIYAIRMYNFLRFGTKNNSIVFDLTDQQKQQLMSNEATIDEIYDAFAKNPASSINQIKINGIQGLLGIVGKIDGNSESSNGAGKSTIMEAICYAHYGKIVRLSANTDSTGDAGNLIVTQVNGEIPEGISESWVEEYFESNGKIYRIKRGRSFSKTRKTSSPILEFEAITENNIVSESGHRTTDTKKSIDEVNDMPYELFVNSQMFGQNDAGKFLFGTDKTRKEMLISLLDMESAVSQCLKNVRERHSKSEKKIESIRQVLSVLEGQLVSIYKKYSKDNQNVYSDSMSNNFILAINQLIEDNQIEIQKFDQDISLYSQQLIELSNSDEIVKMNKISEEGIKTKRDRGEKTKQRDEQMSQWLKLISESSEEEVKKANERSIVLDKIQKLNSQIQEIKKFISSFDKNKYEDEISKAAKAKEVKPKYEIKKQELSDKLLKIAESISETKTKLNFSNNAFSKFSNQMAKIGQSGKIECLECGYLVEKSHFESKISEENEKKKLANSHLDSLNVEKNEAQNQLLEINSRLNKIADFMQAELSAISAIANFNSKSQMLDSLTERLLDLEKTINIVTSDLENISAKKKQYNEKTKQIEILFKKEIDDLDLKLNDLRQKMAEAKNNAEVISSKINAINFKKKELETKKSKLNEQVGSVRKELEQFKLVAQQYSEKNNEMSSEIKILSRYDKLEDIFGLDGIQTRIVKRYLPLLNVYIKEFLDILTDGTLNIKMLINEKSEVDMSISGGTAPMYKMLSGGEKMIIRLAVDIGLALLKFARSAKKPEIICLDEIFGPLDASRTSAVFKMLHALQDKFNRVLIITHNSDIKEIIPNNILVEKSGGLHALSEIKYIT